MWKIVSSFSRKIIALNVKQLVPECRYFMSHSYSLQEVWDKRMKSPILSKIKVEDMYYELENQFNHFASASALDIDLFANAVVSENNIEEVEDIVHKLRLSPEAVNILESTHHAFIRLFLTFGYTDELLRILNDRLNYGIFPDDYCTILMIDKFLRDNNYRDAAKVAVLQMLQEDFSNPIVKYMALYSCLKYLENPSPWNPEVEEVTKTEDDDEEIKVRVSYIRNPFFDDHFDLVSPHHLIGKTLVMIGCEMSDDLGRTYQLIGNCLHNKWDCLKTLIETCLNSNKKELVFKDGITLLYDHLNKLPSEEKDDGNELQATKKEIMEMLNRLETSGLVSREDLLKTTENRLKKVIEEREQHEIEQQSKVSYIIIYCSLI